MTEDCNTSFTSRGTIDRGTNGLWVGCFALLAWVLFLAGGLLISTERHRSLIGSAVPVPLLDEIKTWWVVVTCFTVTNVAFLCCLSSLLGGIYRAATRVRSDDESVSVRYLPYLIQGFAMYLLLISGLLLVGEEPFSAPSQSKYIRLAGSASILSFLGGYKPRLFIEILERFERFTDPKSGSRK